MELLQRAIEFADVESLNLFSGFRGSGKTTELYRLRKNLEEHGFVVLYADALDYLSPATPIGIADLLIILAGAFSDALEERKIDLRSESLWKRFENYLKTTIVNLKEIGFKAGADLKLELTTNPTFRQRLSEALRLRDAWQTRIELPSVHRGWSRRPIGPSAGQNHEDGHPFFRIVPRYHRRARQIGSPAFHGITRNEKHEMGMPAHVVVAQVLLLRHHVAHRSRSQRG
jgi:hypothetical protein